MRKLGGRRLFLGLQVAVTIGLLVAVWRFANGSDALELLAKAHPGWIVAAVAALSLQIVVSAFRWQLTARQLGISLPGKQALREYYLSQIVNQTLPGGVLGDAARAVRSKGQAGLLPSAQAVVLERLAGQIGLVVVLAGAFLVSLGIPGRVVWPGWLQAAIVVIVLVTLATPFLASGVGRLLPERAKRVTISFEKAAIRGLIHPKVRWAQLGLSVGTAALNISGFVFCAWALGIDFEVLTALVIVPLVLFTMLIPVTISGWGLREAAAVALFPLTGLTPAEGLAASIAFGVLLIVIALPGLFVLRSTASRKVQ